MIQWYHRKGLWEFGNVKEYCYPKKQRYVPAEWEKRVLNRIVRDSRIR
jgi:hypothetical protein